jgi:rod shape determining protein RodA
MLTALQPDMGSTVVFVALFIVLFREGMSPFVFVSGVLAIVLFFMTLIINNFYLSVALVVLALVFIWFATRKWKIALTGGGLIAIIGTILYVINYYFIKKFDNEIIILVSVLLSGFILSWYIYIKKAIAVFIVFLFLIGSLVFVNSVDYTFNHVLPDHQRDRINILLGIKSDPHGSGYNVNQSIISIGSGGLTGKGFLQGTQTKFKFVPKQSSDFIFCTIGEEWGFFGSLVMIGTYLFLLLRLIFLAERQRSVFSRAYGYGVVSILFIHVFINIGMAIGIVPVIGIPLPFFSYGGSSLWGFTLLLFVFLRLDASRNEYLV